MPNFAWSCSWFLRKPTTLEITGMTTFGSWHVLLAQRTFVFQCPFHWLLGGHSGKRLLYFSVSILDGWWWMCQTHCKDRVDGWLCCFFMFFFFFFFKCFVTLNLTFEFQETARYVSYVVSYIPGTSRKTVESCWLLNLFESIESLTFC